MMVPAVMMSPSLNFILAKFLASASVSNVLVERGHRGRTNVPLFGTSKVTYQARFIFDPNGIGPPRLMHCRICPSAAVLPATHVQPRWMTIFTHLSSCEYAYYY